MKRKLRISHPEYSCLTCSNCIPIGEGDHICNECGEPKMVISDYAPTEEYMVCGGSQYET